MATRAENVRAEQQHTKPPRPPATKHPKIDDGVDTSKPGVSATDRRKGATHTADRNEAGHAADKATSVLEDSESGVPSRKSTRKSGPGGKASSNLDRREQRALVQPEAVAERAKAQTVRIRAHSNPRTH
jgi:hypothetical protein